MADNLSSNVYLAQILASLRGVSVGNLQSAPSNVYLAQIAAYFVAAAQGGGGGGSGLTPIANNTVLGNVSGASAIPIGLTQAQMRTFLGLATVATTGSASDIGIGTLALARLPAVAQNDLWQSLTFTPTTLDWYRIIDQSTTGGELAGMMRVTGTNAAGNKWSLMFTFQCEGSAGSFAILSQLWCTNQHDIDIVKSSTDNANRNCIDLHFSALTPVTVEYIAYPLTSALITAPVAAIGIGTDTQLFPGPAGVRTTAGLTQGTVTTASSAGTLFKSSGGDLIAAVSGTDYTKAVTVPASATATGVKGNIAVAAGFIYICVATNTWQRAIISTF